MKKRILLLCTVLFAVIMILTACKGKTVTFDFDNGSETLSVELKKSAEITEPAVPQKEGYDFLGWVDGDGNRITFPYSAKKDTTLRAIWQIKSFTYTFYDEDGVTVLKSETAAYGSAVVPPESPTKEATAEHSYAFTGWDKAVPDTLTGNMTFTAVYAGTVRQYTYTFYDEDGVTELKSETAAYGSAVVPPENPAKEATAEHSYTFTGWDKAVPGALTGNMTFTAVYASTVRQYTYTFYDDDGVTELKSETAAYGSAVVPPQNPTKEATAEHSYAFTGWDKAVPDTLTGNMTFTAVYADTTREYTYTFYDEDGVTVLKRITAAYGSAVVPPENPQKQSTAQYTYSFAGWNNAVPSTVTGNISFSAVYNENLRYYEVVFASAEGELTAGEAIQQIAYNGMPVVPVFIREGYRLTWDKDFSVITADIKVNAVWIRVYRIDFIASGETQTTYVDVGEQMGNLPVPQRENYVFNGWNDQPDGAGRFYIKTSIAENDITLYADWYSNGLNFTLIYSPYPYDSQEGRYISYEHYRGYRNDYDVYTEEPADSYYTVSKQSNAEIAHLEIPNFYKGRPVKKIISFSHETSLLSAKIPKNVKSVMPGAFSNCTNLSTVTILSDDIEIGHDAFSGTAIKNVLNDYFLIIGHILIGYYGVSSSPIIPTGVTVISPFAFNGVTNVVIPKTVLAIFNNAFTTNQPFALSFEADSSLQFIGRNAFNVPSFLNTELILPEGLRSIGSRAFQAKGLTSVTIPSSVEYIGTEAFMANAALSTLQFGQGNSRLEYIGDRAFADCSSLEEATLPNGIDYIGEVIFQNTAWYNNLPDGYIVTGDILYGYKGALSNPDLILPSNIRVIAGGAFIQQASITKVVIPEGVVTVGPSAFDAVYNATQLVLPSTLTYVAYRAFASCYNVAALDLSLLSELKFIGDYAFYSMSNITDVFIPSNVECIGIMAFGYCYQLQNIEFAAQSSLKIIKNSAFYYSSVASLILPRSLEILDSNVFSGCDALKNIEFEEGSQLRILSDDVFSGCFSLESVALPNSLEILGHTAFTNCSSLVYVYVPSTAETSLVFGSFSDAVIITDALERPAHWDKMFDVIDMVGSTYIRCEVIWGMPYGGVTYSFDSNGGSEVAAVTGYILNRMQKPTKEGYYFAGWYDNADLTGNKIALPYIANKNMTLYAAWSETPLYTEGLLFEFDIRLEQFIVVGYEGTEKEIIIPEEYEGYPVCGIGEGAFTYMDIEKITIPEPYGDYFYIGAYAFQGCKLLTTILLPNKVYIRHNAFFACYALDDIYLPKSAKVEGDAFSDTYLTVYTDAILPSGNWEECWDDYVKEIVYGYNLEKSDYIFDANGGSQPEAVRTAVLTSLPLSSKAGEYLEGWYLDEELTELVTLPLYIEGGATLYANWTSVKPIAGSEDFEYYYDGEGVTIEAYYGYAQIVYIPDTIDGYPVIRIGYEAFFNNDTLLAVYLPDTLISVYFNSFSFCRNLKYVDLARVETLDEEAFNMVGISSVTLPATLTSTGNPFSNCYNLTDIMLEDGLSYYSVEDGILYELYDEEKTLIYYPGGKQDESLTLSDNLNYVYDTAFYYAPYLKEITIDNMNLRIFFDMFGYLKALESVTILQAGFVEYETFWGFRGIIYLGADVDTSGWEEGWDDGFLGEIVYLEE